MVCGWNPTDFDKFDTEMLRAVASSGKELEVGDIGKTLRFKADGQEGILGTSLVQKGDFIKARGQDLWTERAALGS